MSWPVMPTAMERLLAMMGRPAGPPAPEDLAWGRLGPGTPLPQIQPLFPRIDVGEAGPRRRRRREWPTRPASPRDRDAAGNDAGGGRPGRPAHHRRVHSPRLAGRAGEDGGEIPNSAQAPELTVDLRGEVRQIVSGIADAYEPEALLGKKVVLVANLKPAKLMGVESFGMVLAASIDGKAVLCGFDTHVPPGTKVK